MYEIINNNCRKTLFYLMFKIKQLAKVHKDKAELDRMKREVAKSTVEKGVNECTRLTKIYDKKRIELEKQHEEVRQRLEEERAKVYIFSLNKDILFFVRFLFYVFILSFYFNVTGKS